MSESLDQKLTALKLGRIRQIYESWIEQAAHSNLGYAECFEHRLDRRTAGSAGECAPTQDETGRLPLCSYH